jgi:hypothetical protein
MQSGKQHHRRFIQSTDLPYSLSQSMTRGSSLPQLPAAEEISQNIQFRELRTPSPAGLAVHKALWHPLSNAKAKEKPEIDFASQTPAKVAKTPVRRHKKGGLSLQLPKAPMKPHFVVRKQQQVLSQSFFSASHSRQPSCELNPHTNEDSLENELTEAIANLTPGDFKAHGKTYSRFFTIVIARSTEFKGLLAHLMDGYEQLIDNMQEQFVREVAKLQNEIIGLQTGIIREADERKLLLRKIDKLSRENLEMGQQCDNYDKRFTEFQDKLYDIANVDMEDFPPTENAWRLLNSELDHYRVWRKKWDRELHISQSREKKLSKLVQAIKARGFPVEDVYNSEVRTPALSVHSAVHREVDEDESVRLVEGRPSAVQRPAGVPGIDLTNVEPDITPDSSSDESVVSDATLRMSITNVSCDSESPGKRSTGPAKGSKPNL